MSFVKRLCPLARERRRSRGINAHLGSRSIAADDVSHEERETRRPALNRESVALKAEG